MLRWTDIGFRENPYDTLPVRADDEGASLLVGRDRELDHLRHAVTEGAAHVAIDGDYGVGKTSLNRVLAVHLRRDHAKWSRPRHFPLLRPIEVQGPTTAGELSEVAYLSIAQTLTQVGAELQPGVSSARLDDLNRLLNTPVFRSIGGGGTVLGVGGTATRSAAPNATFRDTGLTPLVNDVLTEHFPRRADGGLVVTLENVELAGSPDELAGLLHGIRDSLLAMPGLRWVFTGAGDALRRVAATGPLGGVIDYPFTVEGLGEEHADAIIAARRRAFQVRDDAYLPVDGPGFAMLISVANGNLRYAFGYASGYSAWALRERVQPSDPAERREELSGWLLRLAESRLSDLPPLDLPAWRLFDDLQVARGQIGLADLSEDDGRPMRDLEERGLADRQVRHDSEVLRFTLLGWLIGIIPESRRI